MTTWFEHVSETVVKKLIDFSTDTFMVALTATANPPVATNDDLTDLTEISYTNLSARTLTATVTRSGGTTKIKFANINLAASGGSVATFRYLAVYDDTTSPKYLIFFKDLRVAGVDIALNAGDSIDINFDQSTGAIAVTEV